VSVSRVVTAVAKVGVFCTIVLIGVVIFRGTSASTRLSDAWAMYKCPAMVQADLAVLLMEKDAKVRACEGPATRAVCQVETVEWRVSWGAAMDGPRRTVKSAPLGPWDCTRRHASGMSGMIMKTLLDAKADGAAPSAASRMAEHLSPRDRQMLGELDSIAALLNRRQALVDAQETKE
jgi:hypothetical protein